MGWQNDDSVERLKYPIQPYLKDSNDPATWPSSTSSPQTKTDVGTKTGADTYLINPDTDPIPTKDKNAPSTFTVTVVNVTNAATTTVASVADQVGLMIEPLGTGQFHWKEDDTPPPSNTTAGRFSRSVPLILSMDGDAPYSVFIRKAGGNGDVAIYRFIRV